MKTIAPINDVWTGELEEDILATTDMAEGTRAVAQDTGKSWAYSSVTGWVDVTPIPSGGVTTRGRPLVRDALGGVEFDTFPFERAFGTSTKVGQSSTTEADLFEDAFTITGGSLPSGSIIRGFCGGVFMNHSGSGIQPTIRAYLGSGLAFSDNLASISSDADPRPFRITFEVSEYNTNAQWWSGDISIGQPGSAGSGNVAGFGSITGGGDSYIFAGTTAVDLSLDQTVTLTIQMPSSDSTLYFEVYRAMIERR